MRNKKQTAVEWFSNLLPKIDFEDDPYYRDLFNKAKEMEKQQIIDAYESKVTEVLAEEYYKETYEK